MVNVRCLIASPRGGLCNRLLALASSMRVAERSGRSLLLDWVPDAACGARFEQIFLPDIPSATAEDLAGAERIRHRRTTFWGDRAVDASGGPDKLAVESYTFFFDSAEREAVRREGPGVSEFLVVRRLVRYWEGLRPAPPVSDAVDPFARRYAASDRPFPAYRWLSPYLNRLRPVPEVVAAVEAFARRHALDGRIGVHVRRGDQRRAIKVSTDDKFLRRMTGLTREDPAVRFFLCTDSESTRRFLLDSHCADEDAGGMVCRPAASYDRSASVAIVDALIDLLLLSRCKTILGSFGSTFSVVAALLGGGDFEWVQ